jgi:archaellum component FlaC
LFPSAGHLRAHLAEYSLAFFTALLLSATLSVKHDLVSQIENFKLSKVDIEEVDKLFDFGLPEGLSREISSATLDDVVQPMLASGKVEEAGLLVRSVIALGLPDSWLTQTVLIITSLVLSLVYLVWFALRRFKTLRAQPDSPPKYAGTLRSMLTLALCVGLLLASTLPLASGGDKILANSALNAMAYEARMDNRPGPLSDKISRELATQQQWASYLYCPECQMPRQSIWEVVDEDSGGLDGLFDNLDKLERDVAACQDACSVELERFRDGLDQVRNRLGSLINGVRANATQFNELQTKLGELERTITASTQRLLEEQGREIRQMHSRDWRRIVEQISGLEEQIESIWGELENRVSRDDLRTISRQLSALQRPINAMQESLSDLERRVRTLESYHRNVVQ